LIYSWKKIVLHGLPLLSIFIFAEIFAGQILLDKQNMLLLFPIFLISFPVINGVAGNIGSVLGARLASGLHVGYIEINIKDKKMHENLLTALFLGLLTFIILGLTIYYFSYFALEQVGIGLVPYMIILLITGFVLVCIVSVVSIITAFWSFKKGWDPDDFIAPVVTTVADVVGIYLLFLLVKLLFL